MSALPAYMCSAWQYFKKQQNRRKPGRAGNLKVTLFKGAYWKRQGRTRNKSTFWFLGFLVRPSVCFVVLYLYLHRQYLSASLSEVCRCHHNDPRGPFLLAMSESKSGSEVFFPTLLMKDRSEANTCFSDTSDCPFLRKARWISNTFFISGLWPSLFKSWLYKIFKKKTKTHFAETVYVAPLPQEWENWLYQYLFLKPLLDSFKKTRILI